MANELRIYSINPINRRLFYIPELGMFQLNESYRYILGRSEIYIYHQLGTNPLWLASINDIASHLEKEKRKNLDMHDLALYVDKIRKVEEGKRLIDALLSNQDGEEAAAAMKKKLQEMYEDGSLQYTIERLAEAKKPQNLPFHTETVDWLNAYYGEDVVSRLNLYLTILIQEKFRLKTSLSVPPDIVGRTMKKPSVALVVINNRVIEIDPDAKVKMNEDTGEQELHTKHYGIFKIKEARTRYKYGKQAIYFVMVKTKKPKVTAQIENANGKEAKPQPKHAELQEMEITVPQKAKAGRKAKIQKDPIIEAYPDFVEHETLKGYYHAKDNPNVIYQASQLVKYVQPTGAPSE